MNGSSRAGDFGVLVHGGHGRTKALCFNLLSGLTFLLGGIVTYAASFQVNVAFLLPFAAGITLLALLQMVVDG